MKGRNPFVMLLLLPSALLLRPDTFVTADDLKPPADLVTREVKWVRDHIETISAKERQLKEELLELRGELKDSQALLEKLQADGKGPAEIDAARRDVENVQSEVNRQEALIASAQKIRTEYEAQLVPGDIFAAVVSRSKLTQMRDEIKGVCDSERGDLKKMQEEYERLLKNGDLKAPSLGDEIQKRRQRFNALIDVYKDVQLMLDKTQL